jgi:hypothetical protein
VAELDGDAVTEERILHAAFSASAGPGAMAA